MCLCSVAGILTADSLARVIDQLILGQQNGLLSRVLQLLGTTVDGLLRLILPSITGPLDKGACTTTIPDNGYPKCPAASAPAGACTFGCNDGYKVCGTGCILQAVTCPSSVQRRSDRRLNICPQGWTSCPVAHGKKIAYECVATQSDLESCGGCAGIEGQGVDCSALVGVNDVSVSLESRNSCDCSHVLTWVCGMCISASPANAKFNHASEDSNGYWGVQQQLVSLSQATHRGGRHLHTEQNMNI